MQRGCVSPWLSTTSEAAMHPLFPREITITCEVSSLAISPAGLATVSCQHCQTSLDVHQPDEKIPTHLLATCGRCGDWYMIELLSNRTQALMVTMPGVRMIRAALAALKTGTESRRRAGHAGHVPIERRVSG